MHKKRTNISPRFVGNMLLLLFAVLVVVSLGILSMQSVAHSATQNTSSQNATAATVQATPAHGAMKVNVTLDEFKITSSITTFKVNTPYYFIVKNIGDSLHEFFIMPDKPNGANYLVNGEYEGQQVFQGQEIQPGRTLMVNYTFAPASTTRYEIACLMRGHYAAGMSHPIVVTK